jgi:hypothetical protein
MKEVYSCGMFIRVLRGANIEIDMHDNKRHHSFFLELPQVINRPLEWLPVQG